jgi:hypothetical protein
MSISAQLCYGLAVAFLGPFRKLGSRHLALPGVVCSARVIRKILHLKLPAMLECAGGHWSSKIRMKLAIAMIGICFCAMPGV